MTYDQAAEEARKAKWDADAAETAAKKAAREEAEASSAAAIARREAVAEKDAAAARREQVAALIPDFSKVERGELKVAGDEPTAGTPVAGRALQRAAELVKQEVIATTGADDWSVLITSDADLAGSDAAYWSTLTGLERLETWAKSVLDTTASVAGASVAAEGKSLAVPIAAALAAAVPGALSLLSAHRTVTTGKVTIDDVTAAAAVAGVLKGRNAKRKVFHDTIRPLPSSGVILSKVDALYELRQQLTERKVTLDSLKQTGGTEASDEVVAAIGLVGKVSDSIEELLGKLVTVPDGATRSPLAAAILREGLHNGTFKYVLFVKAQSASGMQLVNDKPLWAKDTFAVLAAASISWMLVDGAGGDILDANVTTGTAQAEGKIGDTFQLLP
jgi:hypothetical protein